jgi:hypothetical protein
LKNEEHHKGVKTFQRVWQAIIIYWCRLRLEPGSWKVLICDEFLRLRRKFANSLIVCEGWLKLKEDFELVKPTPVATIPFWINLKKECRLTPMEKDFVRMWRKNILPELPWIKRCFSCNRELESGRHFRSCPWVRDEMKNKFGWFRMLKVWRNLKYENDWKGFVEEVSFLRSLWKCYVKLRVETMM